MRVLVTGDRTWKTYLSIRRELEKLPKGSVVIHGAAPGADSLADLAAQHLGLEREAYPADWTTYGKAAGPIRNTAMIEQGKPELVLAFHPHIEDSKGTRDCVAKAMAAEIPVKIFTK